MYAIRTQYVRMVQHRTLDIMHQYHIGSRLLSSLKSSSHLLVYSCFLFPKQAPARCVEHSVKSKRQPELVVGVCKGASSVAPAECLDSLPKNISNEAALRLCNRAEGRGPAVCANVRGQLNHGPELTARLCRGASGQGPADCFRRSATVTTLSTDERVQLCRAANTDAPARYDTPLPT